MATMVAALERPCPAVAGTTPIKRSIPEKDDNGNPIPWKLNECKKEKEESQYTQCDDVTVNGVTTIRMRTYSKPDCSGTVKDEMVFIDSECQQIDWEVQNAEGTGYKKEKFSTNIDVTCSDQAERITEYDYCNAELSPTQQETLRRKLVNELRETASFPNSQLYQDSYLLGLVPGCATQARRRLTGGNGGSGFKLRLHLRANTSETLAVAGAKMDTLNLDPKVLLESICHNGTLSTADQEACDAFEASVAATPSPVSEAAQLNAFGLLFALIMYFLWK